MTPIWHKEGSVSSRGIDELCSFSEWSFEFQKIEGQAFVYGQSLLSNDFVPSLSSSISLTQVSIGDNPLYGSVFAFQQSLGISSEQLSQIPLNIDDW